MKTCPFCAEPDLQDEAKVCKHCGKDIVEINESFYKKPVGCASTFGILFAIVGVFYWPLWILAVLLFILAAVTKKPS